MIRPDAIPPKAPANTKLAKSSSGAKHTEIVGTKHIGSSCHGCLCPRDQSTLTFPKCNARAGVTRQFAHQWPALGSAVPSDYVGTGTRNTVRRSCGTSAAIIGESGKFAP